MKKLIRRVVSALILLCVLLGPSNGMTVQAADEEPVKVGYYLYSDFQEVSEQGGFSGYAYDYFAELAQYTNWEYDFQILSFEECLSALADGTIDVICGLEKTTPRQEMYEFSQYPIGTTSGELYTLKDNEELQYNDYEAMDGMTVALLRGNQQENRLDEYCRRHQITINKLQCSNQSDVEEALRVGAVDAIYLTHTGLGGEYKTIAVMDAVNIYFATTKGSPLIDELDETMSLLNAIYPNFQNELGRKYEAKNAGQTPNFTREELAYISEAPVIRVVLDPDWRPIEYWDKNGNYSGITSEIFARISELSGLQFEYVQTETFSDSIERVQKGDASLLTAITHDYEWAERNNVWTTSPYMELQIVVVSKNKKTEADFATIAMPRNHYLTSRVERDMPDAEIIYYDSVEECLVAVNDGEAEATYVNSYMANYYLSFMEYQQLYQIAITAYRSNLAIAVSKYADNELLSILNKSLLCITDAEVDTAIIHNAYVDADVSLSTIVMMYPFQSILFVILVVGALVVLFVGIILKINSKNKKMSKNVQVIRGESEELKSKLLTSLAGTYDAVYEIDVETDTYSTMFVSEQEIGHQMVPYHYTAAVKDYANRYIRPEDQDKFIQALNRTTLFTMLAKGRKNVYMEADIRNADTMQYHRYSFLLERMNKNSGKILGFLKNIDEETKEKEKLILQSQKDPLTGLLNKEAFYAACDEYLSNNRVHQSAVAFIDLDNFKLLNDTFGHLKGDEAIKQSASKLQTLFSHKDILARFGGDEFCVMIRDIPDEKLFDKLQFALKQLEDTYTDGTRSVTITASIGVVQIRNQKESIASLLDKADRALYKAKKNEKNRYVVYSEGMRTDSYIGRNFDE